MEPIARPPEELAELDPAEAARVQRRGRLIWPAITWLTFIALGVYVRQSGELSFVDISRGRALRFEILAVPYAALVAVGVFMPVVRGRVDGRDRVLFGGSIAFGFGALTGIAWVLATSFGWLGFVDDSYNDWVFSGPGDVPMLAIYACITGLIIGVPTAFIGMLAGLLGGLTRRAMVDDDELEDELEMF